MTVKAFFDSIAFRISISIAVVIAASTVAVGWLILSEEKKTLEGELRSKGRYIAELLSHHLVEPLLYEERHAIYLLLEGAMKSQGSVIAYAELFDSDRESIVSVLKDDVYQHVVSLPVEFSSNGDEVMIVDVPDKSLYHIMSPVVASTFGTVGYLNLYITKEYLLNTIRNMKNQLFMFTTGVIFAGILLGLFMARRILSPIVPLSRGVKKMGEGELGIKVPEIGHGEIKQLACSFNRMSKQLKDLVDKMQSAQDHLIKTEKLYAIGEFSAGIAHEIKNPLTPIMMLMHRAREERDALSDRDIDIIESELNRIDRIVTEFLAFARSDDVEMTEIDINEVIHEVTTLTRPKMDRLQIQLTEDLDKEIPRLTGNHDSLKQVFLNIVLNAVQAMNDAGGKLSVRTYATNGHVRVVINDTGIGIPEEYLEKIYDPFFTTKTEGTGMGLALAHNIINDHSGTIRVRSHPGAGTTVTVELTR